MNEKILLLRGSHHMEFAYKTLHRKNVEVIEMDHPSSLQIAWGDKQYIISDVRSTDEIVSLAKEIYKKEKFTGIATFATSAIISLGILSDFYGLNYFNEETARLLSNKIKTRDFLRKIGCDNTNYYAVKSIEDLKKASKLLGYPFVLKPSDNASSRGVIIIHSDKELDEAFKFSMCDSFNGTLLAEEMLKGQEYCIEALYYNSKVYLLSISKKLVTNEKYCIELMDITPAPLEESEEKEIREYFVNCLSQFNINNLLIHIEFKKEKGKDPAIIEINPRPAGGKLLESEYFTKGINPFDLYFDLALKRPINIDLLQKKMSCPPSKYALFYSFVTPEDSGYIKKIHGIPEIQKLLIHDYERLNLENAEGDYLAPPTCNSQFRGCMYLLDESPEILIARAKEIESKLKYDLKK